MCFRSLRHRLSGPFGQKSRPWVQDSLHNPSLMCLPESSLMRDLRRVEDDGCGPVLRRKRPAGGPRAVVGEEPSAKLLREAPQDSGPWLHGLRKEGARRDRRDLHGTGEHEAVGGIPVLGRESCPSEGGLGSRYEEGAARRPGSSPGTLRGDAGREGGRQASGRARVWQDLWVTARPLATGLPWPALQWPGSSPHPSCLSLPSLPELGAVTGHGDMLSMAGPL